MKAKNAMTENDTGCGKLNMLRVPIKVSRQPAISGKERFLDLQIPLMINPATNEPTAQIKKAAIQMVLD